MTPFGNLTKGIAMSARVSLAGGAVGAPGVAPRNTDNPIRAADLHLTPNGKFLYASERSGSTLAAFSVDAEWRRRGAVRAGAPNAACSDSSVSAMS